MLGKMDAYVTRTVVGSYAAGLLFLLLLVILLQILVKLGVYMDAAEARGASVMEVLGLLSSFYLYMVPSIFVTIAPFVTVIAAMFAVARLMAANEIVPMVFTGRNMYRVLRPVLLTGVFSGLAMAACWEFVIPHLARPLEQMNRQLEDETPKGTQKSDSKKMLGAGRDLLIRNRSDGGGARQSLYCRAYDPDGLLMSGIEMIDEGAGPGDVRILRAAKALWNPEQNDWELTDGHRRVGNREKIADFLEMEGLTPEDMWLASKEAKQASQMSYTDLLELQALRPGYQPYRLAFNAHITFPLANVILLLLALPFAVYFERGNKVERVVFSILICAGYLITDLICQNLGAVGTLHPVFAAWLPTIVFGSFGVVFFSSVQT